jgi:hypothetical protein
MVELVYEFTLISFAIYYKTCSISQVEYFIKL